MLQIVCGDQGRRTAASAFVASLPIVSAGIIVNDVKEILRRAILRLSVYSSLWATLRYYASCPLFTFSLFLFTSSSLRSRIVVIAFNSITIIAFETRDDTFDWFVKTFIIFWSRSIQGIGIMVKCCWFYFEAKRKFETSRAVPFVKYHFFEFTYRETYPSVSFSRL